METLDSLAEYASKTASLEQAFKRFNEASGKLEQKYEHLLQETESLRAQLREKDLEMQRAERLAMLGETAAGIAHEVRNPLGAIAIFASLLKQELVDRPEALELVVQIERSVVTLDRVVSNILQFSKDDSLERYPVNLHSLISEQVEHFLSASTRGLRIFVDLQGSPFVNGNEPGLRQVFYNIILNSVQAVRNSGTIWISSMEREEGQEVVIRDDGPGVPDHILDRMFEPFITSKNEGTGLGLAIVRRIMEQHGAEIKVTNVAGGAEFRLLFVR